MASVSLSVPLYGRRAYWSRYYSGRSPVLMPGVHRERGWLARPGVNLASANLTGWNLNGVNLSSANLSGGNFSSARLSGANLTGGDHAGSQREQGYVVRHDLSGRRHLRQRLWSHVCRARSLSSAPEHR